MSKKTNPLRAQLEQEREHLTAEMEQLRAAAYPSEERREGSPFGKREEEATESLELERRLALEKQTREQLGEVEAALVKFDQDTFGKCENCGEQIDPARLEALPQARLCLKCKAQQPKYAKGRFG